MTKKERMDTAIRLLLQDPEGIRKSGLERGVGCNLGVYLSELLRAGIVSREWDIVRGEASSGSKHGKASLYSLTPRARTILEKNQNISYAELKILMDSETNTDS